MSDNQVRLDYDDHAINIIDKINKVLATRGLKLKDDEKEHDGYILLDLVEVSDG